MLGELLLVYHEIVGPCKGLGFVGMLLDPEARVRVHSSDFDGNCNCLDENRTVAMSYLKKLPTRVHSLTLGRSFLIFMDKKRYYKDPVWYAFVVDYMDIFAVSLKIVLQL